MSIDMVHKGAFINTQLYLISGTSDTLGHMASADDGGEGLDARIARNLQAGWYTLVSTTFGKTLNTGDYLLDIGSVSTSCPVVPFVNIYYGDWSASDCKSQRRPGRNVDYYLFTMARSYSRVSPSTLCPSTRTRTCICTSATGAALEANSKIRT